MYTQLVSGLLSDVIQYAAPANAATVNIAPGATLLFLNPAGALATLTVNLPANPADGQRLTIAAGALITILSITGGTVKGLITSLALNGYARFAYSMDASAWFRTG